MAASNVPLVRVRLPEVVNASPRVTAIPAAFTTTPASVLPAVISVPVPVIVIIPV